MHQPGWEYLQHASPVTPAALNKLGRQGWELVGIENEIYHFKRQLPDFRSRVTLEQKAHYYGIWGVELKDEQ